LVVEMDTTDGTLVWTAFDCDGRSFEYAVLRVRRKERPKNWPAHKPSPGRSAPEVLVMVRNAGDEKPSAGMVLPDGTGVTVKHARDAARMFWGTLTGQQ
jgi:hypothetical protein